MSIRKGHDFARAQDPTFNLRVLTGFGDHPTKPHLQFKRVLIFLHYPAIYIAGFSDFIDIHMMRTPISMTKIITAYSVKIKPKIKASKEGVKEAQ